MKICSIIVTYNRKELLVRCIKAVIEQTYNVNSIIIIDNASTDNTYDKICKEFEVEKLITTNEELIRLKTLANNCILYYYKSSENMGGAGGFAKGLELADKMKSFDAFWMMDDDGYPSNNCLEIQLSQLKYYDYVMPVSIDIENKEKLSWPTRLKNKNKTLDYSCLKSSWGKIMNYIYPFNGSLLSKEIVESVGYINKNLFIWGDEYEHYWRCKKKGFNPITTIDAKFYHPANKMQYIPILFGLIKVPFSESELRMVCLARNYTYIYWKYDNKFKILLKLIIYTWLYLITRKLDFKGYKIYLLSVIDGIKGKFDRHKLYLKK